jgi:hypothetical protein
MKINKFYIFFLSFLIFITSCQGIKEGLVGNKRSKSSDEFLVQKKNPLVLPPDFEILPTPKTETNQQIDADVDIEDLLGVYKDKSEMFEAESSKSLEKSILEKINTN